ncbi:biotin-dependent carboxyltransferase family protein [Flavobacteriaceae sp. LMIT009]
MIKVLQTGFYSSIQDLGRFEFQEYGVPISGVMDMYSAKVANAIVGNMENDAVLEITMTGPKLEFTDNTLIGLSGANISPMLNGKNVSINTAISLNKGDILSFGRLKYGFRVYLAVSGGFQTKQVLSSRSMYKNVTESISISKGDVFEIKQSNKEKRPSNASIKIDKNHFNNNVIDVIKGPEFDKLTDYQAQQLLSSEFTISKENSRMAYQLEESLDNELDGIITSLVLPGTVQLTPSGKLIVLMRDCQTTGGYPRVLQLNGSSINRLSQKFTGQRIKFKLLD